MTDITLRLARMMGVTEEELVHIRRGALLHDIGKMAIPDNILLKPGPLTDEEWIVMRRHPVFAYEMLSPIDYLRPALDTRTAITRNGTGRAIRADCAKRRYRSRRGCSPSWTSGMRCARTGRTGRRGRPKRCAGTSEQSGKHFDPQVFLCL